ncbi:MAG TPA: MFS transporter [Longimicrobiales bacterium]|nr:MFS transporter [Longimicrobiales bacterium]
MTLHDAAPPVRLGLRENWLQFALLVLVNAFVGTMVGVERSVLPVLAEQEFGVGSATAALSFLVAFGLAKALANFVAGRYAQWAGRRRLLLIGWLFALPVPLLLWWAPTWNWVIFANLLLGINQGLAWSATVIMKIDLAGPKQRGLAMGLNEAAGYIAVALAAFGAGALAASFGPRAGPVWIGGAAALLGLMLTLIFVRDTAAHVELEHALSAEAQHDDHTGGAAARSQHLSWRHPALFAANQAGFVNNLNDGLAWGLFPLFFAAHGMSLHQIGVLAGLYPAVWGIAQIGAGALSDRSGRMPWIVSGMLLQSLALGMFALSSTYAAWLTAAALLGLGTAAVYPTLIAHVSDVVSPRMRASSVGVYRLWRDLGYVAGGLLAGVLADLLGYRSAIGAVAILTALSGLAARACTPARRP